LVEGRNWGNRADTLLSLGGATWYFFGDQIGTVAKFHRVGRNPHDGISGTYTLKGIAPEKRADFLVSMAKLYPCYHFDGSDRFCQVQVQGCRNAGTNEFTDIVNVFSLTADRSIDMCYYWTLPFKCTVNNIEFLPDGINISIFGDVSVRSYNSGGGIIRKNIDENSPLTLFIPWEPGHNSPFGHLDLAVAAALDNKYDVFLDANFSYKRQSTPF
jgi:hypothetical protein